ncbi:MAG: hypothetical protein ACK5GV_03555 [Bacteroidota bacterium]|jgi:hypothetical protein
MHNTARLLTWMARLRDGVWSSGGSFTLQKYNKRKDAPNYSEKPITTIYYLAAPNHQLCRNG